MIKNNIFIIIISLAILFCIFIIFLLSYKNDKLIEEEVNTEKLYFNNNSYDKFSVPTQEDY